jgi:hypothetical protein
VTASGLRSIRAYTGYSTTVYPPSNTLPRQFFTARKTSAKKFI